MRTPICDELGIELPIFAFTHCRDVVVAVSKAGDHLVLFYPSANRDEDVFDDPFAFRVDRDPNPHLGFGVGEHFCLGASLARAEIKATMRQIVDRLPNIELAGPPARLRSDFVNGIKRMPVTW